MAFYYVSLCSFSIVWLCQVSSFLSRCVFILLKILKSLVYLLYNYQEQGSNTFSKNIGLPTYHDPTQSYLLVDSNLNWKPFTFP